MTATSTSDDRLPSLYPLSESETGRVPFRRLRPSYLSVLVARLEARPRPAQETGPVSYRNKTYVAFASENIGRYWLMQAWRANQHIEFDFFDAHTLYVSRDTSLPSTIKANLRERMKNAKQVVYLGSAEGRAKGSDGISFLAYEIAVAIELDLPIVIAHLDGSRGGNSWNVPQPLLDVNYHVMSVSFRPAIIRYALDDYAENYSANKRTLGPRKYNANVYTRLGL